MFTHTWSWCLLVGLSSPDRTAHRPSCTDRPEALQQQIIGTNNYSRVRTISSPFPCPSGYSVVFDIRLSLFHWHSVLHLCRSITSPLIYLNINFKTLFSSTMQYYSSPANTLLYELLKRQIAHTSFRAGNTDSSSVTQLAVRIISQVSWRPQKPILL